MLYKFELIILLLYLYKLIFTISSPVLGCDVLRVEYFPETRNLFVLGVHTLRRTGSDTWCTGGHDPYRQETQSDHAYYVYYYEPSDVWMMADAICSHNWGKK